MSSATPAPWNATRQDGVAAESFGLFSNLAQQNGMLMLVLVHVATIASALELSPGACLSRTHP
jgi:hypothetical protein